MSHCSREHIDKYWYLVKEVASKFYNKTNTPNIVEVEDLEQQLFFALEEAINKYNPNNTGYKDRPMTIESWIKKICRYRLLDYARQQSWIPNATYLKMIKEGIEIPEIFNAGIHIDNNETYIEQDKEIEDLSEILFSNLDCKDPELVKQLLILHYTKNMSIKLISEKLNISIVKAYKALQRVLPEIRARATSYDNFIKE